jgi:hypothetical protein
MLKEHSVNTILRHYCSDTEVCRRRKKGFYGVQNDTVLVGLAQPTFQRQEFRNDSSSTRSGSGSRYDAQPL